MNQPAAVRRLCLAVDVQGYSGRDNRGQLAVQSRLKRLLDRALSRTGVSPAAALRQDRGDGQLVLLPAGVDEAHVISTLLRELGVGLADGNTAGGDRLRVRVALAQGVVHEAATGYVGKAVVDACRLVDAPPLRSVLTGTPGADLVVAVTGDLFQDVVANGYAGLSPEDFTQVPVELPDKAFSADMWVAVPEVSRRPETGGRPRTVRRTRLAAVVAVPLCLAVAAYAAWHLTGGPPSTAPSTTSPITTSSTSSPAPVDTAAPFVFFDPTGQISTCGPVSGSGWVPPGFDLRVYAEGGDRYFPAWNPARADRATARWELEEIYLGEVKGKPRRVRLYAVLLPSQESAKLTREFEEKWSFENLPPRVVATHTYTVVEGVC